jgi:hypothetical protein
MTAAEALEFVHEHAVVLESGSGPVPMFAADVVVGPIGGSWCEQRPADWPVLADGRLITTTGPDPSSPLANGHWSRLHTRSASESSEKELTADVDDLV